MSDQNDKPHDLSSMVRSKRKANRKAATTTTRDLPDDPFYLNIEPPKASTRTKLPVPSSKAPDAQKPEHAGTGNASATSSSTSFKTAADQAHAPTSTARAASDNPHTRDPSEAPREESAAGSAPVRPKSPATSEDLEDIDLRSPSDDPDYDFIDKEEAMHSARNAQPDRANKYPELEAQSTSTTEQTGEGGKISGKGKGSGGEKKKRRKGWFF